MARPSSDAARTGGAIGREARKGRSRVPAGLLLADGRNSRYGVRHGKGGDSGGDMPRDPIQRLMGAGRGRSGGD